MAEAQQQAAGLTAADLEFFSEQGYLVLPGIMSPAHCEQVKRDIDLLMLQPERDDPDGPSRQAVHIAEKETLGALTVFEPVVSRVAALMDAASSENGGERAFSFHHQHASRMDAGTGASDWHHDYEAHPQVDRELLMVHCFYYPNGLNGEIGDLIVLPRSHKVVMDRGHDVFGHLFNDEILPGTVSFEDLPEGSAVIVHSALLHARRAKPGGEGKPRYFSDLSYCQHSGAPDRRWPAYQVANRPTLDFPGGQGEVYAAHRLLGRDSGIAHEKGIFELESVFYDQTNANPTQLAALERAPGRRTAKY